jgi:thiol-disulfide isomerase/thioredoxin
MRAIRAAGAIASSLRSSSGAGRRRVLQGVIALALIGAASPALAQAPRTGIDLSQYKGKVVYVDFWASWCAPCQQSFPWMADLARRRSADDFALVAVNVDHDRTKADAFLKRVGSGVNVVFDPDGTLAAKFGVKAMPTSFVIGRDGRTRFTHQGFFPDQTASYESHVMELLHEK